MGDKQNPARTLTEKRWGSNFIESIPIGWRVVVKTVLRKTPGVRNGSDPDPIVAPVVTSEVVTNRINELEKNTTELDAEISDAVEHGQQRNRQFGIPIPFTRRLTADGVGIGDANKEIEPFNPSISQTEELDLSVLTTFLSTYALKYTGRVNVDLPDRLVSVAAVMESNSGDGASTENGTASLSGNGSISLSLRATAQASASILPKTFAKVQPFYGSNIVCTHAHVFLLAPVVPNDINTLLAVLVGKSSTVTVTIASPGVVTWTNHGLANGEPVMFRTTGALPTGLSVNTFYYIVNKATNTFQLSLTVGGSAINTSGSQSGVHTAYRGVSAWPKYNPVVEEIRIVGGRFSLQVSASSQGSASLGDTGSSSSAGGGTGYSEEKGLSVEMVRISPVIHPLISLSGTLSTTQAISASAASEASGVGPAESISRSGSIAASITPTTLAATTGSTDWPTAGIFLYRIDSEPFIENFVQFHCVVVDAADFPNN
jgi:hypothetical protein